MTARLSRTQGLLAAGVTALVVIGGATAFALSGTDRQRSASALSSGTPSSTKPTKKPSPVAKPKPKPTKKPAPAVNPLPGIGSPPRGPVLAVKIDDTGSGRPSVGLDKADVIYIEQAE